MKTSGHTCPVCAYPNLREPARSASGGGSYEICPSCGFQFGVDDDDKGIAFEEARTAWLAGGARWSGKGVPMPKGWNGRKQLQAAEGEGTGQVTRPASARSRSRRTRS
ncbi:MAG: hypothetical protein K1X78_28900 [Verrucomicrobiaceae bacterium]|nr:hypothetical protein [Verrucomicrobiaceae bacterium]